MTKRLLLLILIIIFIIFSSTTVSAENINQELYSGKKFRNPFVEYEEPAVIEEENLQNNEVNSSEDSITINSYQNQDFKRPQITTEDLKRRIPFSLNGIINTQNNKTALLNTGTKVEIIKKNYEYNGYRVTAVKENSVIVEYNGLKFRLNIGGKVDEI